MCPNRLIVFCLYWIIINVFWYLYLAIGQSPEKLKIKFVDYFFENGSPVILVNPGRYIVENLPAS